MDFEKGITIGELSKLTGVHVETIRYYERIKMMPKPPRTEVLPSFVASQAK